MKKIFSVILSVAKDPVNRAITTRFFGLRPQNDELFFQFYLCHFSILIFYFFIKIDLCTQNFNILTS
jgi:hypothetical protein